MPVALVLHTASFARLGSSLIVEFVSRLQFVPKHSSSTTEDV